MATLSPHHYIMLATPKEQSILVRHNVYMPRLLILKEALYFLLLHFLCRNNIICTRNDVTGEDIMWFRVKQLCLALFI
jgi:hypothetical protein